MDGCHRAFVFGSFGAQKQRGKEGVLRGNCLNPPTMDAETDPDAARVCCSGSWIPATVWTVTRVYVHPATSWIRRVFTRFSPTLTHPTQHAFRTTCDASTSVGFLKAEQTHALFSRQGRTQRKTFLGLCCRPATCWLP